jgi:hypothetical protein
MYVTLNLENPKRDEKYTCMTPTLVVGNLVMGERYAEPQGVSKITNENTGEFCEIDFRTRGAWSTKLEDKNFVRCEIKSKEGKIKYVMEGKYTEKLTATNVETSESFIVYEATQFPDPIQDIKHTHGMNLYALQLNNLSEKLKSKLPPTDSRFRPDIRSWETADMEDA